MTQVTFKIFEGELIALFPNELFNENVYGKTMIWSYQRVGQHGAASSKLLKCKKATPEEYSNLKKELVSIGYDDLEVL